MRVLIINTSERIGGAAIAANRLMEALKKNGIKARMLVRDKQTDQMTVERISQSWMLPIKFLWERVCIWLSNGLSKRNIFQVDIANTGTDVTKMFEFEQADVIHLHWVNQGFLSTDDIARIINSGKPVVITMHDMWYFTGICHYSAGCQRYTTGCHHCPLLTHGGIGRDLAQQVYNKKQRIYGTTHLAFIGCSNWITQLARASRLTQGHYVANIPNAINTATFHPIDKTTARQRRQLPTDGRRLILFGSQRITDPRKGFTYLAQACQTIKARNPKLAAGIGVVVLGSESEKVRDRLPFTVYTMKYMSGEQDIMELYNAVDLFVTPSLQDNLPNTIVEAMACGTPCVGFNVGGIPEMIDHKENGYVAQYMNADDLARGIEWCLDTEHYDNLCTSAHNKALATYSEDRVARRYTEVYEMMMEKPTLTPPKEGNPHPEGNG